MRSAGVIAISLNEGKLLLVPGDALSPDKGVPPTCSFDIHSEVLSEMSSDHLECNRGALEEIRQVGCFSSLALRHWQERRDFPILL